MTFAERYPRVVIAMICVSLCIGALAITFTALGVQNLDDLKARNIFHREVIASHKK
jgi:hypothetical protein